MIIVGGSLENAVYFLIICYTDSFEDNGDSRRKTKDLSLGIVTSQWCRGKELACQCWRARDRDLIPGSERSPEVGNEEPGGPQSAGLQSPAELSTHTHCYFNALFNLMLSLAK